MNRRRVAVAIVDAAQAGDVVGLLRLFVEHDAYDAAITWLRRWRLIVGARPIMRVTWLGRLWRRWA